MKVLPRKKLWLSSPLISLIFEHVNTLCKDLNTVQGSTIENTGCSNLIGICRCCLYTHYLRLVQLTASDPDGPEFNPIMGDLG